MAAGLLLCLTGAIALVSASSPPTITCDPLADTYRLTTPGSYAAFIESESPVARMEIHTPDGAPLAASPATASTATPVDGATAARFDISPPPVFEVGPPVDLRVDPAGEPYELVLVRIGESDDWSDLVVTPPVTRAPGRAYGCGQDSRPIVQTVLLDAVYHDVAGRQVFVVAPTP